MIAPSLHQRPRRGTVSFTSTLYLCPILDLLLEAIPPAWQPELRLGLQEALVNAAKHGNKLDPRKTIVVRYALDNGAYSWTIANAGVGFNPPQESCACPEELLPDPESDCGRGLCILHKVFDRVIWNENGTQLELRKVTRGRRPQMALA